MLLNKSFSKIIFVFLNLAMPSFCMTNLLEAIDARDVRRIEQLYVEAYYPFFVDINRPAEMQSYRNEMVAVVHQSLAKNGLLSWFLAQQHVLNSQAVQHEERVVADLLQALSTTTTAYNNAAVLSVGTATLANAEFVFVPEVHSDAQLLQEQFFLLNALLTDDDILFLESMRREDKIDFSFEYHNVLQILVANKFQASGLNYDPRNSTLMFFSIASFLQPGASSIFVVVDGVIHVSNFAMKKVNMAGWDCRKHDENIFCPTLLMTEDIERNDSLKNSLEIMRPSSTKRKFIRLGAAHVPHYAFEYYLGQLKELNDRETSLQLKDYVLYSSGLTQLPATTMEDFFADPGIRSQKKSDVMQLYKFCTQHDYAVLDFARVRDEIEAIGRQESASRIEEIQRGLSNPRGWQKLFDAASKNDPAELMAALEDGGFLLLSAKDHSDQKCAFAYLLHCSNNRTCIDEEFFRRLSLKNLRADIGELDSLINLSTTRITPDELSLLTTTASNAHCANDAEIIFFADSAHYQTQRACFHLSSYLRRSGDFLLSFYNTETRNLGLCTSPTTAAYIALLARKRALHMLTKSGELDPLLMPQLELGLFKWFLLLIRDDERLLSKIGNSDRYELNIIGRGMDSKISSYSTNFAEPVAALATKIATSLPELLEDNQGRLILHTDLTALPLYPCLRYVLTRAAINEMVPAAFRQQARDDLHVAQELNGMDEFYDHMSHEEHRGYFANFAEGALFPQWAMSHAHLHVTKHLLFYGNYEVNLINQQVQKQVSDYLQRK